MSMSFKYVSFKDEEFDSWNGRYITVYKRGAIHKVSSKTKEECQRILEKFYDYITLNENDFCTEGLGQPEYDNIKKKWVGESYIFLDNKDQFNFYKELYKEFKLIQ